MQKKNCRPNFDNVLYNFVQYGTVQYRVPPPHKSEFFFFAFLDESDHFQCFPKGFRENPRNSKKVWIWPRPPPLVFSRESDSRIAIVLGGCGYIEKGVVILSVRHQ